jgi:hypothetical protein
MPKCKLILLEGIPGSGKSSVGAYLQAHLKNAGIPAIFWREGDFDHPADFEGIACLDAADYQDLLLRYPALAPWIGRYTTIHGNDHLLGYRKLQHRHPQIIPRALIDELSARDVYDGLPVDDYCRLALQRWQDFVRSALASNTVTLLECCLLQNPLTVLLARHDVDPQIARDQIKLIAGIIRELNPLILYLNPQNSDAALQRVRAERPKEWSDFVTAYLTGQAFGKSHHLSGFEGVVAFYEFRKRLELELLKDLPVTSFILEHSGNEWERVNLEVISIIQPLLIGVCSQ